MENKFSSENCKTAESVITTLDYKWDRFAIKSYTESDQRVLEQKAG